MLHRIKAPALPENQPAIGLYQHAYLDSCPLDGGGSGWG